MTNPSYLSNTIFPEIGFNDSFTGIFASFTKNIASFSVEPLFCILTLAACMLPVTFVICADNTIEATSRFSLYIRLLPLANVVAIRRNLFSGNVGVAIVYINIRQTDSRAKFNGTTRAAIALLNVLPSIVPVACFITKSAPAKKSPDSSPEV
jgi:hypothetical protein